MTTHQPQVGDTITTGDIRALPGRTILLFHGSTAASPFVWLSDAEILIPPLGVDEPVRIDDFTRGESFTIAYLPGQPPRPEREVKAEALREAAAKWQAGGWAKVMPRGVSRPGLILGMAQHAIEWLRTQADLIEAGETR